MDRGMRAGEFTSYVKHLMLARGDHGQAAAMARSLRAPERVIEHLKAAVPAMHEGPMGGPRLLVSAFLDALTMLAGKHHNMIACNHALCV